MTFSAEHRDLPAPSGLVFGQGTGPRHPEVSFEFFPPRTEKMEETLWASIRRLAPVGPRFVSVTYGAGGSTRERTHATVARIQAETGIAAAAHLTCVDASAAEIEAIARAYWEAGIRHVVALRGDPPAGTPWRLAPGGYAHAHELVAGLTRVAPFEISVAAFPEVHPEAPSPAFDLDNLKRKIDAGATRAITQFFFDNAAYLRFWDRARAAGITVPIVPGILPITNFTRTLEFAKVCGATVPPWLAELFEGLDDDPETRQLVSATVAVEQCRLLQDEGMNEFHFYTLNRAELTLAICRMLGLRQAGPHAAATEA
jgi:methylenetetrahydrofolate reductase (NADPH)